MSFLRRAANATTSAVTATASAVSSASTKAVTSVSNTIHDPGNLNNDLSSWNSVLDPVPSLYNVSRGNLKFRFVTDTGKVMIYCNYYHHSFVTILEYKQYGLIMKRADPNQYKYVKYKEHNIKYRTYSEIVNFVKKYYSNNKAHFLNSKRREFAIRLAEYCNVSINEIDGKYTLGIKAASQMYTLNDTIKGVSTGIGQIVLAKPITGTKNIISSVGQNTAKFGVATVKSVTNQSISNVGLNAANQNDDDEKYIIQQNNAYDNQGISDMSDNNKVVGGNIKGDDCPICYANGKSHAMQCGHILCWDCIQKVTECPFCKQTKVGVVKLFNLKDDD